MKVIFAIALTVLALSVTAFAVDKTPDHIVQSEPAAVAAQS